MSLVNPIPSSPRLLGPYTATAGQVDFAANFYLQLESDISVTRKRAGPTTLLVLHNDYEVIGADNPSGFTIRLLSGALAGDIINGKGLASAERLTSVSQAGQFSAVRTDKEFDRSRIIEQELRRDVDVHEVRLNNFSGDVVAAAASAAAADLDRIAAAASAAEADLDRIAAQAAAATIALSPSYDRVDRAALIADNIFSYNVGTGLLVVSAAQIIRTRSQGFAYSVMASGAVGQNLTTAGGVKLLAVPPNGVTNVYQRGAVGDGVTNDASYINAVNVAGGNVNLDGRAYAYQGAFAQVARFFNGVIISSVDGFLDYTREEYSIDTTITVGPTGTIKSAKRAFDFLKWKRWIACSLTLAFGAGVHDVSLSGLFHSDTSRLFLLGAAMLGAVPTNADMTGVKATDEAFVATRFASVLNIGGTGDNAVGGFKFSHGLGGTDKIFYTADARYCFDIAYNASHGNSNQAGICRIKDFAFSGGVWALNIISAEVRFVAGTSQLFMYQNTGTQPGGPMNLFNCNTKVESNISIYLSGQSSKYGVFATIGRFETFSGGINIKGPFLHGIYSDGCNVVAPGVIMDGVSQPITLVQNGHFDGDNYAFSNGDVANTNTLTGSGQLGFGNNDSVGSFIHVGVNCSFSANNGTMTNMVGAYAFHSIQGKIGQGASNACALNDCKTTLATARLYNSSPSYLAVTVTAPKAGSLDQVLALAGSYARMGTNSGVTFSPAINTVSNGNLIANVG